MKKNSRHNDFMLGFVVTAYSGLVPILCQADAENEAMIEGSRLRAIEAPSNLLINFLVMIIKY